MNIQSADNTNVLRSDVFVANCKSSDHTSAVRGASIDEIVQHVIDSCTSTFSVMCGIAASPVCISNGCSLKKFDMSGTVSIIGDRKIIVSVRFSRELAFTCTEALLGAKIGAIDADVLDLVGELANMTAGGAKERLDDSSLSLGLPTIVVGSDHHLAFPKGMSLLTVDFECDSGDLQIEVAIEKTKSARG